jgi:hypothetical protein
MTQSNCGAIKFLIAQVLFVAPKCRWANAIYIGVIAEQAHTFELLHLGRKDEQVSDHIYWNKGYTIIPSRDSQYLLIISLNII